MLEELSKQDKKWRIFALTICNDKHLADDLVNDMYIKLHDSKKKPEEINDWYIYRVIKTIFIDKLRKDNKIKFVSYENIEAINDTELTERRKELNDKLNQLTLFDREILLNTAERSLRENIKYFDGVLSLRVLHYSKQKALQKLKELYNGKK